MWTPAGRLKPAWVSRLPFGKGLKQSGWGASARWASRRGNDERGLPSTGRGQSQDGARRRGVGCHTRRERMGSWQGHLRALLGLGR